MALMATPWKHPSTGVYYLRRQIPEKLRPAFDGKALWKVSLGTKNSNDATVLFLQANAALEQRFEEARTRLKATGSPCPSARDRADEMVAAYFQGPEFRAGGLDGEAGTGFAYFSAVSHHREVTDEPRHMILF